MTGEHAVSEGTAVAISAGEIANRLKARLAALPHGRGVVAEAGDIPAVLPAQVMAQLGDSLSRAIGRMDDVSLKVESTAEGTSFNFRAYKR